VPNADRAALAWLARAACADDATWGGELAAVPGFADAVAEHLTRIVGDGVSAALGALLAATSVA
jgi:hypothetical protein